MGILGLIKHITDSSYLEDYELQNTDLVIDGCCLYKNLLEYAHFNCVFGGDYDKYEETVSDFFDCLLRCNVKPLVFLHGGCSESSITITLTRLREISRRSVQMLPESPNTEKVPPLFLRSVFIQVLREKDIKFAQCLSNPVASIVAVAKALNCPVLSNASYFYLHGVLYIPMETLLNNVMDHLYVKRKMIPCKIYRIERLLNSFEGLNQHTLSLISVLRSNNNVQLIKMVKNTVSLIIEEHVANYQGVPIANDLNAKILHWLRKHTLEDAIVEIIKGAPQSMRQELLKIIETNINKYTTSFAEPFTYLEVPEECFSSPTEEELYRFKGNIETSPYEGVHTSSRRGYIMEMSDKLLNETEQVHRDSVISKLPQWVKQEYWWSNFPPYAMDVIQYHFNIFPILTEVFNKHPSCSVALKIWKIVFQYVMSVTQNNMKRFRLNYVMKYKASFRLDYLIEDTFLLSRVRSLSLSDRKKILHDALEITDAQFIDDLLFEWQLYIACLRYWKAQQISAFDKSHMYSILTCLIYKLTISKMGYYNCLTTFKKSNSTVIKLLQSRKCHSIKPEYSLMVTVVQACKEIDTLDCLLAAPFFISHSQEKPDLSHGNQFKRDILYAFSQFQCTLIASMDLNALLDFPYKQPKIANLYNGTLLYNLCVNFRICEDMETYKNNIFKDSPSLLRVFNVLFKLLKE